MTRTSDRLLTILAPLSTFTALVLIWQVGVTVAEVSTLLLPSPAAILGETFENLPVLISLSLHTALNAVAGTSFGIVAALLAAWLVHGSARLSSLFTTLATGVKAMPIIALFPIAAVFLGNGPVAVATIVAVAAFPIAFVYAIAGLRRASDLDEVMSVIAAGRVKRFWSMRLPLAMPYILTGVSTILPLSVISSIIAEYFGGPVTTLGTYIRRESANMHTVSMWSAILLACVLGLLATAAGALAVRAAHRLEGGPA